MCGRNSLFIDQADLEARFDAEVVTDGGYTPRYNIAPGDDLHIVTNEAPGEIDAYHWGLIPFWADEPEEGIINARSETADEKRVFERVWESRPCLVPSSGFYEWKAPNGGTKQPYRIFREDDLAFAMAGLWDVWEGEDETISCVTILTTEPNDLMNSIHDRMPVVLPGRGVRLARCRPGHPQGTVPAVSEGRSGCLRDFDAGQQSRQRRSPGYRAAGPRAIGPRRVQFGIAVGVTVTASATPLPNRQASTLCPDSSRPLRLEEIVLLHLRGYVRTVRFVRGSLTSSV